MLAVYDRVHRCFFQRFNRLIGRKKRTVNVFSIVLFVDGCKKYYAISFLPIALEMNYYIHRVFKRTCEFSNIFLSFPMVSEPRLGRKFFRVIVKFTYIFYLNAYRTFKKTVTYAAFFIIVMCSGKSWKLYLSCL